jgi:hypothetical protein
MDPDPQINIDEDPRRSGSKKRAMNCSVLWPRLTCLVSVLVSRPTTRADVSGKASALLTGFFILAKKRKFNSVLWIRISFNADPDPAFLKISIRIRIWIQGAEAMRIHAEGNQVYNLLRTILC